MTGEACHSDMACKVKMVSFLSPEAPWYILHRPFTEQTSSAGPYRHSSCSSNMYAWWCRFPHWFLSVKLMPGAPPPPGVATHKAAAIAEGKDPEQAVIEARAKVTPPLMRVCIETLQGLLHHRPPATQDAQCSKPRLKPQGRWALASTINTDQ